MLQQPQNSPPTPQTPQYDEQLLEKIIQDQLEHLINESHQNQSTEDQQEENINSNIYFDKQLAHLVITEEFDFKAISQIISNIFRFDNINTSENACRLRWSQLNSGRSRIQEIKEKTKQNKRIRAVASFSNPYSLYSLDQLIQNLEINQKNRKQQMVNIEPEKISQDKSGYSIFSDSFRKINNTQQYEQMKSKMMVAMVQAEKEVYQEKPMLYMPEYQKSDTFEIKGEQLTADRAKKMMAFQIQMEKISRQMTQRKQAEQEQKYQSVIKKKLERQGREDQGDFQQNWDEYESD